MTPSPRPSRRSPGFALLLTLLGILVLEIMVAGTFHVATQQVRTARAASRALEVQLAAQSAAARALVEWHADTARLLGLDSTRAVAYGPPHRDIQQRSELRRVDTALYHLRAQAVGTAGESASLTLLVRTAAIPDYLGQLSAAATVGGAVSGTGTVTGAGSVTCGDSASLAPIPALVLADSALLPALDPDLAEGAVIVAPGPEPIFEVAGIDLTALASRLDAAELTQDSSLDDDTCEGFAAGVQDPAHPCRGHHHPVLHARGDLVIRGGAGQGVLLVDGDAHLEDGAVFHGLLFVRGSLTLAGAVLGAVRVGGSLVLAGGTVRFEPCRIARTISRGRGLRGPFRADPHWWLPM